MSEFTYVYPQSLEAGNTGEKNYQPDISTIIATVGNHEGKAVLLSAMQSSNDYSAPQLHDMFLSVQGSNPFFTGRSTNQIDYANTMESVGLLASSKLINGNLQYAKTKLGDHIGSAVTGHLLGFSLRNPTYSLKDFFGSTQSTNGNRAASNRIAIFRALLDHEPTSIGNLRLASGVSGAVLTNAVKSLQTSGLINYEYSNLRRLPSLRFEINPEKIERSATFPRLGGATDIALAILENEVAQRRFSIDKDLFRIQFANDLDMPQLSPKALLRKLNITFEKLQEKGVLIANNYHHNNQGELTKISLSGTQRDILTELSNIVSNLQNADPEFMIQGKELATEISGDPSHVQTLFRKCYGDESAKTNPLTIELIGKLLVQIFKKLPEQVLTADDIRAYLKYEGHKTSEDFATTKKKLGYLVKLGSIATVKIKGEDNYIKVVK